ncbi:hypothetical protein V8F20_004955 [Naviculisporaceae sp. PSN 640]
MLPNHASPHITVTDRKRVFPQNSELSTVGQVIPLSLLDATTANLGLTSAVWLFRPNPDIPSSCSFIDFSHHLLRSLAVSLNRYPQWCGQIKAITTLNQNELPPETATFPPHARRFGRLYSRFNTPDDPGVELITATSSATWTDIYPEDWIDSLKPHVWCDPTCHSLKAFSPSTYVATMFAPHNFTRPEINPVLAIQITKLSSPNGVHNEDGGFVLAAKAAHPLTDITGLAQFINHWATLTRHMSCFDPYHVPPDLELPSPVFKPSLLDDQAAGDINQPRPVEAILREGDFLVPFHLWDWWLPGPDYPRHILPSHIPPAFQEAYFKGELKKDEGGPMPWSTWDLTAPVSTAILHFTPAQVNLLHHNSSRYRLRSKEKSPKWDSTKHDAILAHIWTRIVASRNFTTEEDRQATVWCYLTLGLRQSLNLPPTFQGSPIVMVPIQSFPDQLGGFISGSPGSNYTASFVREAELSAENLAGLLGTRHTLVTSWAKSGIYEIDFGFGHGRALYVDGDVPVADGFVLIKEGGPCGGNDMAGRSSPGTGSWTDNGVDVSVSLNKADMERLLNDPLLFPAAL